MWPSQSQPQKPFGMQNNAPMLCHRGPLKLRVAQGLSAVMLPVAVITKHHLKKVKKNGSTHS